MLLWLRGKIDAERSARAALGFVTEVVAIPASPRTSHVSVRKGGSVVRIGQAPDLSGQMCPRQQLGVV